MKNIKIIFTNFEAFFPTIAVDGKILTVKLDKKLRRYYAETTVNNNLTKLHIFKWYELSEKRWALKGFLNWLLSLGGLLSAGYEKVCPTVDIELEIVTIAEKNLVEIALNAPRVNAPSFRLKVNNEEVAVTGNEYKMDTAAIKHRKTVRALSFFGFLALLAAVVALIVFLLL